MAPAFQVGEVGPHLRRAVPEGRTVKSSHSNFGPTLSDNLKMAAPSLQQLIDAAAPGSVLRLPPGPHLGTFILRKPLTLLGSTPQSVIDGGGKGPALLLEPPPGARISLVQLTLQNGSNQQGGCLFAHHGQVTLTDCIVRGGSAPAYGGGGIYAACQTLLLERTAVLDSQGKQGGGLLLDGTVKARLVSCLVAGNSAKLGGGIRLREGAQLSLEGCTLAGNMLVPLGEGAQLYATGTSTRQPKVTLLNCIIGGDANALYLEGEFPAQVTGSHVLLPEGVSVPGLAAVLRGNPGFRGKGTAPYALAAGSQALGAGSAEGISADARDVAGTPRLVRGRMDLGAYAGQN